MKRLTLCLGLLAAVSMLPIASSAFAQQAVIATVNDRPVTDFDVDQRIKLLQLLGERRPEKLARKKAANDVINDYIKVDEAKLNKIDATDKEINDRVASFAKSFKTDEAGLKSKLAASGIELSTLRLFAAAQMDMARLLGAKYHEKPQVDQAAIDKKYAAVKADIMDKVRKVESDPRRAPVQVIELREINFPVDGKDPQLFNARAAEAAQVLPKIKSCDGIRAATAGVFNVQIGRTIQADAKKLPDPIRQALFKRGQGHAIGPTRYAGGIQLLAWCGGRTITPPPVKYTLPERQQIENMAMEEQMSAIDDKYVAIMRKHAIVEYKDPAYAQ